MCARRTKQVVTTPWLPSSPFGLQRRLPQFIHLETVQPRVGKAERAEGLDPPEWAAAQAQTEVPAPKPMPRFQSPSGHVTSQSRPLAAGPLVSVSEED